MPTLAALQPESMLVDLIARVRTGDRDALGDLYAAHGHLVHGAAYRLTRSKADAEDVCQDVFLRLPTALAGFTGMSSSFPGWLRRVAVRQALMHLRSGRRRREVGVDEVSELLGPGDRVTDRLTINAALDRLPPDHRTVFLLREVEGYDHAEIAELLGISTANSEVRLHRARKQLREILGGSR